MLEKIANRREASRFLLRDKSKSSLAKAFEMMGELNKIEEPHDGKINRWRVGITTETQLIVDIDNSDQKNVEGILQQLHILFPGDGFVVIKTVHGESYHTQLIGTDSRKDNFVRKHLGVLNKNLSTNPYEGVSYREQLLKFLNEFRKNNPTSQKGLFNSELLKSGLINPVGDFDFQYNVIAIEKERSTIRLTPKTKEDKWEVWKLDNYK